MDSSLWDPPFYEDDGSDFGGNWQSDIYFDLGHDVIEEDAINERCCIQVLNILVSKADTEIEELEQEIVLLQGQLAWTDEVRSKICSATLTERINSLDLLIQRLKNEKLQKEHELDFGFQTHGGPAHSEKLQMEHEVNFSFRTHGDPAQNEKPQIEHELDIHFKTLGKPSQKELLTEQEQDFRFQTHEESAQNEKLQTEHKMDFHFQALGEPAPKCGEIMHTLLEKYSLSRDEKNSNSNTEKLATCQSKDETKLRNFEALATVAKALEETIEPLHLEASKGDENETHQNGDTTIPDSITIFSEHAIDMSTKRKMNDINSSIKIGQGAGIFDPTSKAEKKIYATEIEKEAYAVMINTSANVLRYEAGSISGKRYCNPLEETCGELVVQRLKTESTANLKPSSMPKETTNTEADMLADIASVCMSHPVKQIAKESISKQKLQMLADADRTDRLDTPQQVVRTERMPTDFPPRTKQEELWLSDSERTIGESFLELLNNKRKDARKPLIKERLKPQLLKQMHNAEVVGTEPSKSKFFLKTESPNLTEKHFPTFESGIIPEPSLAMEMELKLSSMKNLKRKLMSRIIDEKNFENKKTEEETHLDFSGEKSFNVSAVSIHSACQSPGKGKKCIISPAIKKNEELRSLQFIQKMHEGKMNALVRMEDELISNFNAAKDASEKPLKLLSCTASVTTVDLKSLPMDQLKAMAKEHNLTKYSKLNKSDLIKLLRQ